MGDAFSAIGSLADPLRRRLYAFVAGRDDGVGREEVAREVGVPAHTARSPSAATTWSGTCSPLRSSGRSTARP